MSVCSSVCIYECVCAWRVIVYDLKIRRNPNNYDDDDISQWSCNCEFNLSCAFSCEHVCKSSNISFDRLPIPNQIKCVVLQIIEDSKLYRNIQLYRSVSRRSNVSERDKCEKEIPATQSPVHLNWNPSLHVDLKKNNGKVELFERDQTVGPWLAPTSLSLKQIEMLAYVRRSIFKKWLNDPCCVFRPQPLI